ncbi:MAG: NAD(P)(+) transhydrogenase (Re/Si-specific) subunit beta [Bacteroidota bacterium]
MQKNINISYTGVDNPLFYIDNNQMLFGDAKANVSALLNELAKTEKELVSA